MNMHREILRAVVLLVIGSACKATMIQRSVEVPTGHWEAVENGMVKDGNAIHSLLFVSQHDAAEVEKLKEISDAVSYPDSAKYGQFMNYEEVYQSVLQKSTENGHVVERWARANELTVTRTTKNKQYIMVEASVNTVERVFQTRLQAYRHIKTGQSVLRSTSFALPSDIHNRVALIHGLSDFSSVSHSNMIIKETMTVPQNTPLLAVGSGLGYYQFLMIPRCLNGSFITGSFCDNQFNGFQIYLSEKSNVFQISVSEANCHVCSRGSKLSQLFCGALGLSEDSVYCLFYLKKDGSIPLYEPHTITVQTKFLDGLSDNKTYPSPVEKVFDITPSVLRSLYNVDQKPNAKRDVRSRQAVVGFGEYLDLKSFKDFAQHFGKKYKPVLGKAYGVDYTNETYDEVTTSLGMEYMATMGFGIPVDYISARLNNYTLQNFFVQLALLQEDKKNVVPLVYLINYFDDEPIVDSRSITAYELQFMIMSVTGKTVFVGSGDAGSTGSTGQCSNVSVPAYPSTSAYVTSVGATQFLQATDNCSRKLNGYCLEEVAAEASRLTGFGTTSGGGFSNNVAQPKYQQEAVQNYLTDSSTALPPDTFFNRSNRAYPDISLTAQQYLVKVFGDSDLFLSGTSASSAATAGLFSLIVDRRLKRGLKPLGLVNPLLYQLSTTNAEVFYDITKGNNSCSYLGLVCCEYGFGAGKGWDPVTGLGSINHGELMKQLTKK